MRAEFLERSHLMTAFDAMKMRARWYTKRHHEVPEDLLSALTRFCIALGIPVFKMIEDTHQ